MVKKTVKNKPNEDIDFQKTIKSIKNIFWNEKALIIAFLLIALFLGTYFRMYPATLGVADDWAEQSITNQLRQQIEAQVAAQYPNLPTAQRNQFVQEQLQTQLDAAGPQLDGQIQATGEYFRSQLQDEQGQTYLLAIDPYLWLSHAENYVEYGHFGDERLEDGTPNFALRNGREARVAGFSLHPFLIAQVYTIGSIFNADYRVINAAFIMPPLIIGLAIIFAFFLARRIAGNFAGLVAGSALGLNSALLGRTPAGFSDTDAYIIMFPLLAAWLFTEGIYAKTQWKKYLYTALSGASVSTFMIAWSNGWHIGTVLLGAIAVRFIYLLITDFKTVKSNPKKFFMSKPGELILMGLSFLAGVSLFGGILQALTGTIGFIRPLGDVILGPLSALDIKTVASIDIWPNVLTTVAELNPGSWPQVLNSIGGGLFFLMAAVGALLAVFPKEKTKDLRIDTLALLVFWFGGLTVAGILASRFIALLAAPFAIALGSFFGMTWILAQRIKAKDMRIGLQVLLAVIAVIIFIAPIQTAHAIGNSEIPSMNDGWHASLTEIGNDTDNGIITSWWDFGHWFVNVARERVTFDGGDQGNRIYWVGKHLMTPSEEESVAILRMLNCGQNEGYQRLLEETNDQKYISSRLINTIIYEDRDTAAARLDELGINSDYVLEKTHCPDEELFDQYVIASSDMIGKANVWAHFGSWNFTRAYIYSGLRNLPYEEALVAMAELGITNEDQAAQLYFEANNLQDSRAVDSWIAPWPGYVSQGASTCQNQTNNITCSIGLTVQQQQNLRVVIDGLFIDKNQVNESFLVVGTYQGNQRVGEEIIQPAQLTLFENEWTSYTLNGSFPYEFTVGPDATGTYRAVIGDGAVSDSTFTKLMFFDGTGLERFEKFSDRTTFNGQRVIVYKVDLNTN